MAARSRHGPWRQALHRGERPHPFRGDGFLGDGCAEPSELPAGTPGLDMVRLIDVLWLSPDDCHVEAAFEVEHTTSIYSGILRMLDLSLGQDPANLTGLFLVAPDEREGDVRKQLARPAFSRVADLHVRYLPYSELNQNREQIARFGNGLNRCTRSRETLSSPRPPSSRTMPDAHRTTPSATAFGRLRIAHGLGAQRCTISEARTSPPTGSHASMGCRIHRGQMDP